MASLGWGLWFSFPRSEEQYTLQKELSLPLGVFVLKLDLPGLL